MNTSESKFIYKSLLGSLHAEVVVGKLGEFDALNIVSKTIFNLMAILRVEDSIRRSLHAN